VPDTTEYLDDGPLRDLTQRILRGEVRQAQWESIRRLFMREDDRNRTDAWKRMAAWALANRIGWSIAAHGPLEIPSDSVVVFKAPSRV
jgi:hypothetical protein